MSAIRSFSEHQLIALKDDAWIERQRIAGRSVCFCFNSAKTMIDNRIDLSSGALKSELLIMMRTFGCHPLFLKDQKSYSVFVSVNNKALNDSYVFKNDDLIQISIACHYQGAPAKATITYVKKDFQSIKQFEIIDACKRALNNAISQIEVGKRIGCIGSGIHHIVKNTNFNLLSNSFGYGINENDIFADPIILSKSQPNTGMRISDGMTFTIFPSLSFSNTTKELVCSFEKTVFVHKNHVEVITNFDEVN